MASIRAPIKDAGGLHMKGTLSSQSFTISRNWLALGGAISPESAKPQDVKVSDQNKKVCLMQLLY